MSMLAALTEAIDILKDPEKRSESAWPAVGPGPDASHPPAQDVTDDIFGIGTAGNAKQSYTIIETCARIIAQAERNIGGANKTQSADELELDGFLMRHRNDLMGLSSAGVKFHQLDLLGYSLSLQRGARANGTPPPAHIEVSFAALNQMRMRRLQMLLVQRIMRMRHYNEMPDDWEDLLHKYVEAARDGDYIRACVDRGENGIDDPFIVTSRRIVDRQFLKNELQYLEPDRFPPNNPNDGISWLELDDDAGDSGDGDNTPSNSSNYPRSLAKAEGTYAQPIGGLRTERTQAQQWREFLSRFAFSVVGGAFLIVPMWLMVKLKDMHRDLPLIVTTLSVFICGVAAARMLDKPEVVLSITAAYAAVLVVFVGTSDTTSGSS